MANSLILRKDLGRKLTIEEVDGNFLYLDNKSGGGSVAIDSCQIPFGTGTGLTSSSYLVYDNTNLVFGLSQSVVTSEFSSIIGGYNNRISCSNNSVIIGGGGYYSGICRCLNLGNKITDNSNYSTVVGGKYNKISYGSLNSSIISGAANRIYSSFASSVDGGISNSLVVSCASTGIGGYKNHTEYSNYSAIIGGSFNQISCGDNSTIIGGFRNNLDLYSGCCGSHIGSSIIGGQCNTICNSCNSAIIGGLSQSLTNCNNAVMVPNLIITGSVSTGAYNVVANCQLSSISSICVVNGLIVSIS